MVFSKFTLQVTQPMENKTDEDKEINHTFISINFTKNPFWITDPLFCTTNTKAKFLEDALFKLLHFRFCFSAPLIFSWCQREARQHLHQDSTLRWTNWFYHCKIFKAKEGRKTFPTGLLGLSIAILLSHTVQLYSFCHSKLATKTLCKTIDSCYRTYKICS